MKLLDVIALTEDVPAAGLRRGQVGTLVERLAEGVWETEFADPEGRTYASLPLPETRLMVLHHQPLDPAA